ncbi:TPA: hypothetical protein ACLZJ0_000143, partial [Streptococcus pneumoniae]
KIGSIISIVDLPTTNIIEPIFQPFYFYLENNHKYLPSTEYLRYTSINYLFLAFKLSRRGYEI